MAKENVSLDFWLKKNKIRNYRLEGIKHNDLTSEKHKKSVGLWITLNCFWNLISIFF